VAYRHYWPAFPAHSTAAYAAAVARFPAGSTARAAANRALAAAWAAQGARFGSGRGKTDLLDALAPAAAALAAIAPDVDAGAAAALAVQSVLSAPDAMRCVRPVVPPAAIRLFSRCQRLEEGLAWISEALNSDPARVHPGVNVSFAGAGDFKADRPGRWAQVRFVPSGGDEGGGVAQEESGRRRGGRASVRPRAVGSHPPGRRLSSRNVAGDVVTEPVTA
jgi:hypothetical protein